MSSKALELVPARLATILTHSLANEQEETIGNLCRELASASAEKSRTVAELEVSSAARSAGAEEVWSSRIAAAEHARLDLDRQLEHARRELADALAAQRDEKKKRELAEARLSPFLPYVAHPFLPDPII